MLQNDIQHVDKFVAVDLKKISNSDKEVQPDFMAGYLKTFQFFTRFDPKFLYKIIDKLKVEELKKGDIL